MTPDCPFLYRIFVSYQVNPENFVVCPAEAFNPISLAFRRIEFIGSDFREAQAWTFSSSEEATAP